MRAFVYTAVLAVTALLCGVAYTVPAKPALPSSVVKVLVGEGHGSGVHIGNGYILTAAHVTHGQPASLKLDNGELVGVEVLWENKDYDVALLRTNAKLAHSKLSCRTAGDGERVVARGNPTVLEFVASEGKVTGGERVAGPWRSALAVDMTIVMGMSGGGVFDERGNVVGLAVGALTASFGFSSSLTGFGIIVPSSAVCALLARTA